jgi:ribosomal protein L44E
METKVCFKCGRELPLTEFYKHPKMADGHLNKCKNCTKKDVHENYEKNSEDSEYVEKERQRNRNKYQRLYADLHKPSSHQENKNTRRDLKSRGVDCEGKEIHHWNYNKRNDIFLLTPKQHKRVHLQMLFNKESNMFEYNGVLLSTKESHLQAIKEILGINEVESYNLT